MHAQACQPGLPAQWYAKYAYIIIYPSANYRGCLSNNTCNLSWYTYCNILNKTYKITDGHCVSPPGNPMKGKDLEEDRRDGRETNYTTTGRVLSGRG